MSHKRRNDVLVPALGVLFDVVAIESAFLLSYWLRFHTGVFDFLPLTEDMPPLRSYLFSSVVVILVWLLLFNARSMYGARRNVALSDDFLNVIKVVTLGMLIVMSAAFFYRAFSYSRLVFILLWGTSIVFIFSGRAILMSVEASLYRRGKELRNAILIGCNETANRVYRSLNENSLLGYRFLGYAAPAPLMNGAPLSAANYLCPIEDVPRKLVEEEVELALIALDNSEHETLYRLIRECEGVNVEFMMVPDILEMMASRLHVREIEGIPFIRLKGVPMTAWDRALKRSFDVAVSASILTVISPLLLAVALGIKLTSKGPVLFRQERVGIDGERFEMLKFRSMHADAEKGTGPVWASSDDPRTIGIGALLRRTSLDELPQLLNVLHGEMSLVGPRPERPYFVEQFKGLIPKYLDRHRVRTGMTGWAQVNGLRGKDSSLEERIKYDIYYIENWSFGFDLKILVKTIGALLQR